MMKQLTACLVFKANEMSLVSESVASPMLLEHFQATQTELHSVRFFPYTI